MLSRSLPRVVLSALVVLFAMSLAQASPRIIKSINPNWLYIQGDDPSKDEASWQRVNLPHSFSTPYFAGQQFYAGYGWYRKHLQLSNTEIKKRVSLEFDGVFQVAEVFLNGQKVGVHRGGYTGFSVDLTPAVRAGDNLLEVRVNNLWDAQLAPRAGEHTFSGGIYRNVRLVLTSDLHVTWYGTEVTTPIVTKTDAVVAVNTEIANQSGETKRATVLTQVVDPSGKVVAHCQSTEDLPAHSVTVFKQTTGHVSNPHLWSPEHPTLYCVKTTVLDSGVESDQFVSPLGFRWFEFTKDRGFFLNGEHRYLRGANVHQDHAGWGDAVLDGGFYRDLSMVKEAGFDFVRGSHYPHGPVFSEACDKLGLLFWSENCFWGTGGNSGEGFWTASAYPVQESDEKGFEDSIKASLRDMIRIHRNHPSIVVWSMSNEPFFSDWRVFPKVRNLLSSLVELSHQLDPSRPAAIGGCQRGEMDLLGDIAGYNGDGARLFVRPDVANLVSEYGSTIADRPGAYAPGWGDLPTTPGADPNKEGSWRLPWRSGETIWCGFDHGSIAGRAFGSMGMIDYFRLPKRQWYWYRNAYRHVPPPTWPEPGEPYQLKLSADHLILKSPDALDDAQVVVTLQDQSGREISNSVPVKLEIVSGPGEFPTGRTITFAPDSDIAIRDGKAAIEFRSYESGTTRIRATSAGLRSDEITIRSLGRPRYQKAKSWAVTERPYVRYTPPASGKTRTTFGLGNPTRASSETPGHSGRYANDGLDDTYWESAPDDQQPWYQVDLERIVDLVSVQLRFANESAVTFSVEASKDGLNSWVPITLAPTTEATVLPNQRVTCRYLRVWFYGKPGEQIRLREVSVVGEY